MACTNGTKKNGYGRSSLEVRDIREKMTRGQALVTTLWIDRAGTRQHGSVIDGVKN